MAELTMEKIAEIQAHQEFGSDEYVICEMALKYLSLTEPSEPAKCAARLLEGFASGLKGNDLAEFARGEKQ